MKRCVEGAEVSLSFGEGPVQVTAHDFEVRMLANDVALITYGTVRRHPNASTSENLRSSTWKNISSRWRMVFHRGTSIMLG